jgi:UDP-2-acetamido-3-amino-2,3-dideoxy-glucuronate N-acetyltransferase
MSEIHQDADVHESSYVDEGATIGARTKVWHFSHILPNCSVGDDCSLGQNVVVGPNVIIGNRVKIQNNVSVYEGVTLEDGVFCGPSCVFTNVNNPRALIERKNEYKATIVRRGATLGANSTVVCGVTIGEYAFIAAGAVVHKDVKPYALMVGVPARHIGWMSQYGEQIRLPLEGEGEYVCPHTAQRYQLKDGHLSEIL